MQNLDPQTPPPYANESKSARKKKAKADAAANGSVASVVPAVPAAPAKEEDSSLDAKGDPESLSDHPYIKDLTKQIRNIHKKLAGMQKIDAIVAEHPDVSLDELVATRKINADQKTSILKKPQLEAQLTTLEDQVLHYRKFDSEFQSQLQKQRDELAAQHEKEVEKAREDGQLSAVRTSEAELRTKLLVFSRFLRCAAAKRTVEEETDTDESKAFEGALLLVYGGDEKAVSAALKLIEGVDERIPSIEGVALPVTYSQIKQASIDHAPFQMEENWVDSVAEANATGTGTPTPEREAYPPGSDPTIAYAGLTELDTGAKETSVHGHGGEDPLTSPPQGDAGDSAGNAAGDKWDVTAPGAGRTLMEDGYEMIARPQDELDTPVTAAQQEKTNWADDQPPAYDAGTSGNLAGERWDLNAAGDQNDDGWSGADVAAQGGAQGWVDGAEDATPGAVQEDADGFQSVPGRYRGRGGRGRFGEGEYRGRGRGRGGFRGDGDFRGRGRGGFRGRGEGGEFRSRGGRGRGFRGNNGEGQAARGS